MIIRPAHNEVEPRAFLMLSYMCNCMFAEPIFFHFYEFRDKLQFNWFILGDDGCTVLGIIQFFITKDNIGENAVFVNGLYVVEQQRGLGIFNNVLTELRKEFGCSIYLIEPNELLFEKYVKKQFNIPDCLPIFIK